MTSAEYKLPQTKKGWMQPSKDGASQAQFRQGYSGDWRVANTEDMGLEDLGVELEKGVTK